MNSPSRSPNDPQCADSSEIDSYIEDIEVDTFIINENLDFADKTKYLNKALGPI